MVLCVRGKNLQVFDNLAIVQVLVTCLYYCLKNVHFLYFLSKCKTSHDTLFANSEDNTKQAGAELGQDQN